MDTEDAKIVGEDGAMDGKRAAAAELEELRLAADRAEAEVGRRPGLAVILVGDDPASRVYVRGKRRAADAIGFRSWTVRLSGDRTTADVVREVDRANADADCDGILVQMPVPEQIDSEAVLSAILPAKDVDGLTAQSLGRLAANLPGPRSCTPRGIMHLLRRAGEPVAGRHVVIVGRSRLVGLPLSLLMTHADATVTLCHSRTTDLPDTVRGADIVVAAAGRPHLIRPEWVDPDMVLVDVGITRGPDGLLGDVHPEANRRARRWTPVPGGVGPMTIAMLLRNTLEAYLGG